MHNTLLLLFLLFWRMRMLKKKKKKGVLVIHSSFDPTVCWIIQTFPRFALLQHLFFFLSAITRNGLDGPLWNEGMKYSYTPPGGAIAQVGFNMFGNFHQASLKQLLSVLPAINPTIPSHTPAVYSFEWWSRGTLASFAHRRVAAQFNLFFTFRNFTPEETLWHNTNE